MLIRDPTHQMCLKQNFWGYLAQKVYEGGWQASTEQVFINRIKLKLNEIDVNFLPSLKNRDFNPGGLFQSRDFGIKNDQMIPGS